MRCPSCGATVESESQRFCQTCGAPLDPQQLRQQQRAQEGAGHVIDPAIVGSARTSLDSLGNQVNQAIVTRNVGQLAIYAGAALIAVIVVGALVHVVLSLLPVIIIVALFLYFRRNRGFRGRRW